MTESVEPPDDPTPREQTFVSRAAGLSKRLGPFALIYLFYLFLAVGCFLPIFDELNSALIGKPGSDVLRNVWGYWWFKAMLFDRFSLPAFTTYLNFPRGMLILIIDPLNCLLGLPFYAIFGLPAAYNLYLIAVVALNAFAAFLFARYLTGSVAASLIAGAVYGYAPYVLSWSIAGNSEVVNVAWIPIFLLFLTRTLRHGTRRDGVLTGVFLVCTTASSWYYGYIVAIFGSLYALVFLAASAIRRKPIRPALIALGLGASVFFVFSVTMVAIFHDIVPSVIRARPEGGHEQLTMLAGNAVNLWEIYQPAPDRWDRPSLYHFPALVLVVLPFALVLGIKRAWPWALLGLLALVLSLSYKVQSYPVEYAQILWSAWEKLSALSSGTYNAFLELPFGGMLRFPARFLVITNLMIGVVLACGLRVLLVDRRWLRPVWIVLSLIATFGLTQRMLAVSRFHEIFATTSTEAPEFVDIIAKDPDWVGVIYLPTNLQGGMQLYYQTAHEKPLMNYVDFVTSRIYYINEHQIPLSLSDGLYGMHLRGFDRATESYPAQVPDWPTSERLEWELDQLERFGLRYIVVERSMFKPQSLLEFEALFDPFVTAVWRSEEIDLYRLD